MYPSESSLGYKAGQGLQDPNILRSYMSYKFSVKDWTASSLIFD